MSALSSPGNCYRYFILVMLLLPCIFIEACACVCSPRGDKIKTGGNAGEKINPSALNIGPEKFSGALAAYLRELKVIETQSKLSALKQISKEQKGASVAFAQGLDKKSSLLDDDPTGKFKELEPLVKENKVDEIITVLHRIARENEGDRAVVMEADRKLSLCYYIVGDHLKCSGHMAKYNALLEEQVRREDELNEAAIKYLKNNSDY